MTDSKPAGVWSHAILKPINSLRLDPENPRLPAHLQGGSNIDLAIHLDLGFEAFAVAESIATHGFFSSEPLIVVPSETEADAWIVVEGNRRLTALLGLALEEVRSQLPEPDKWERLAVQAGIRGTTEIPVVVAPDRIAVVPIIGFRHISGILAWQPFAQARYVAKLVDVDKLDIAAVSTLIGVEKTKAGNLYREQAIAKQAKDLGIETGNLESAFSLLTVAMQQTKIRDFVGAPLGSQLKPGTPPIPKEKEAELKEVLVWIFGDSEHEPKITDSREISKLATVIANPIGLAALRKGEKLEVAQQQIADQDLDTLQRLTKRLGAARNALVAAAEDIAEHYAEANVLQLLEELQDALDALVLDSADEPEQ